MTDCLFCKIASGAIQSDVVYQDDSLLAFRDIHPQAPIHVLIIPKQHIESLNGLDDAVVAGQLLLTAGKLAEQLGCAEQGYRTVFNTNDDGGQTVHHLHMHLLAGRQMKWPPG